jgi:hypothetical protein
MRRTNDMKLDTDRVVGLSAMLVSLASLFTFMYQARLMRQSQLASAMPYWMIALDSNPQGVYITLRNAGVGPALIEDARIAYQGREIEGDPYDYFVGLRPDVDRALEVDKIQRGRLIRDGEVVQMLGKGGVSDKRILEDLLHAFEIAEVPRTWYANAGAATTEKAVIEITYASVYGERWRLRSDRISPERL